MKLLLVKFVITGLSIATLAACGAPETPQTSSSPIASSTPKTTPEVIASPTPVESVSPPVTISSSSVTSATTNPATNPPNIAIATTGCYEAETALLQLTTKNYIINICGETTPQYYVGREKADPTKSIRLPLAEASPTFFMAVNGDTTYILAQTPRGQFLTVTQGEKELLREVVEGW